MAPKWSNIKYVQTELSLLVKLYVVKFNLKQKAISYKKRLVCTVDLKCT